MLTLTLMDRMDDGPILSFIVMTNKRTHFVMVVITDMG